MQFELYLARVSTQANQTMLHCSHKAWHFHITHIRTSSRVELYLMLDPLSGQVCKERQAKSAQTRIILLLCVLYIIYVGVSGVSPQPWGNMRWFREIQGDFLKVFHPISLSWYLVAKFSACLYKFLEHHSVLQGVWHHTYTHNRLSCIWCWTPWWTSLALSGWQSSCDITCWTKASVLSIACPRYEPHEQLRTSSCLFCLGWF